MTPPYAAYGGFAGATNHYYGPTNSCLSYHVSLARSAGWMYAYVAKYAGSTYLGSGSTTYNADNTSNAVGWTTADASATHCVTFAGDYQGDIGWLTNDWGGSC